jgi:hypothetical protein
MRTKLIPPQSLEVDAVVPQCLDNQFVPDSLFEKMTSESLDFANREIMELRERNFKTEFIRSLIYSSQVIIQRAWWWNSDFLFKNYRQEDSKNFRAFVQFISDGAIIPFLYTESSLSGDQDHRLERHDDGVFATQKLLAELDEVTCVRLALDNEVNARSSATMRTTFFNGLTQLQALDDEGRDAMANELFSDRSRLGVPGVREAFSEATEQLARYAFNKGARLNREDVYRDNFVTEGANSVTLGRFRKPDRDHPFLFELKKYVDLVYNVNLPDRLNRYTFTPAGMPTRLALQDMSDAARHFGHDDVHKVLADQDAQESMRRIFMAHRDRGAMTLPLLQDLTVADVHEIRLLPEWTQFIQSQTEILKNPLDCLAWIEKFQADFDTFQRALSEWYTAKYGMAETQKRYSSYISLGLEIAGQVFVINSNLNETEKALASIAVRAIVARLPARITNYAAKLMVNVYDIEEKKRDRDRSYSIVLMKANCDLVQKDLEALLESIQTKAGEALPSVTAQVADQGC